MKKVYLQPSVFVHEIKSESPILAGSPKPNGESDAYYGGGTDGKTDYNGEDGEQVGGTGDDTGFSQG